MLDLVHHGPLVRLGVTEVLDTGLRHLPERPPVVLIAADVAEREGRVSGQAAAHSDPLPGCHPCTAGAAGCGTATSGAPLDVLSHQHPGEGGHLRMHQVAESVVLSQSATTRLVTRLEDRGLLSRYLCATDRRGIYTDVTEAGLALLAAARPTHDAALREALDRATRDPELEPLVKAVESVGGAG